MELNCLGVEDLFFVCCSRVMSLNTERPASAIVWSWIHRDSGLSAAYSGSLFIDSPISLRLVLLLQGMSCSSCFHNLRAENCSLSSSAVNFHKEQLRPESLCTSFPSAL